MFAQSWLGIRNFTLGLIKIQRVATQANGVTNANRAVTLKQIQFHGRPYRFLSTSSSGSGSRSGSAGHGHGKSTKTDRVLYSTLAVIAGAGTIYIIDKEFNASLITRSARALYVLLWIAYAYGKDSKNYKSIDDLHEIASERLLQMLMQNKGLYIKLGQAIANQGALFPKAYQVRFPKLYDEAPFDSWDKVDQVLKANLGPNYESEIFEWIDHIPVASASIAQVHKAQLSKNLGSAKVALKVQHDYIDKQIVVDLWVYRFISKVYEKVFDIPLSMFTSYVSEQLVKETDFVHEMHNSMRLVELIENDPVLEKENIKIPKNFPKLTTRQVLPAEWVDGIALTDKDELINNKYDLKLTMSQYIKLFGRQIFKYGFVHSDPHPGNLLARFDENGKQQLVLLDHGLYINLPEKFRLQYCKLWKDLFVLNVKGVEQTGRDWGIHSTEIFATIVQLRPVKLEQNKDGSKDDTRDISDLLKSFIGDELKFPKELPFLSRTMRMIQNLNQQFGSPVNRINLLTKEAITVLSKDGSLTWYDRWDLLKIDFSMIVSGIIFRLIRIRQWLTGDKYGGKQKGLEDYIEMYMQNTAKSLGMEWM
ncbi:conserved hypothetical protein [Lodderomyces elongisporus NRRL YB-4239]|uniref:ABC1 atypical kinase-like domain-containing protein n=1 Tax=Lodderomyces elongisporus (strain ATCC 11503 / CBS 2605 / JCM 1781 / NBRC 1676 / NRRL YB-4239) TaxID=379508 RepID=A5E3G2_LODEL|nr:conserved hypothetical protein [Lodderomyces elongisporus NRRL YB-4239]